jgi:hypothetical protein
VAIGDWLLQRDLMDCRGAVLLPPTLVAKFTLASTEVEQQSTAQKAGSVILRAAKQAGLLGVPVWTDGGGPGAEHWTLLVVRRFQGSAETRYYDSCDELGAFNLSAANLVFELLRTGIPGMPAQLSARSNLRGRQANATDCGTFLLHYWEGEVRRFLGEGWQMEFPQTTGCIKVRKLRLAGLVAQIRKFPHPGLLVAGESITAAAENVENIMAQDLSLHSLEVLAARYMEQGLVPFFGCSKCRFSRGGCIDYRCNFAKYEAHLAKYPEKYDGKKLKGVLKDLTVQELVG